MKISIRSLRAAGLSAEQIVALLEREENERLERDRARKKPQPRVPISEISTEATEATEGSETNSTLSLREYKIKKEKKERERGTRIPPDWVPSSEDLKAAREEGLPEDVVPREAAKFRDYWTAKAGAAATKLDWPATWRNWVRRVCEDRGYAQGPPKQSLPPEEVVRLLARHEERKARME